MNQRFFIRLPLIAIAASLICSCQTTREISASSRAYTAKSAPKAYAVVTPTKAPIGQVRPGMVKMVRTTAYSDKENEAGGKYGKKNAIGTTLKYGKTYRSAAADWSRYPLGTKFRIEGEPQIYIVEDYGSALVGTDTIDIYKPTLASMRSWGVRNVKIQIVEWGCYKSSAQVLAPRTKYNHCRQMYQSIQPRLQASGSVGI